MYDSFNRSITYLRVSVTDRCNLRCIYCMPAEGVTTLSHEDILTYEQIAEVVAAATLLGIDKIRLTGGEPLVRKDISLLIAKLKGIPGIREVALTTNALLLPLMAKDLKASGLDRLNISLDSLDGKKYKMITRIGNLGDALAGIEAAISAGFSHTKVNMVLIPGINSDEDKAMRAFCKEKGLTLQRIHRYTLSNHWTHRAKSEAERPLDCSSCNRIRLTADGKLKPCLFSEKEIPVDLRHPDQSIGETIRCKPRSGTHCRNRQIWQIGG